MRYPTKGGNKFQDGGWQQRSKRRASEVLDAVPFKRWITNAILYDTLCNENPFATTYTRKFLRRSFQGAQLIWFQIQSYNAVRQRWHSLFLSIAFVVVFILNLLFWWMIFFQNGGGQLSSKVSTNSIKWVQFVKRKLEILRLSSLLCLCIRVIKGKKTGSQMLSNWFICVRLIGLLFLGLSVTCLVISLLSTSSTA